MCRFARSMRWRRRRRRLDRGRGKRFADVIGLDEFGHVGRCKHAGASSPAAASAPIGAASAPAGAAGAPLAAIAPAGSIYYGMNGLVNKPSGGYATSSPKSAARATEGSQRQALSERRVQSGSGGEPRECRAGDGRVRHHGLFSASADGEQLQRRSKRLSGFLYARSSDRRRAEVRVLQSDQRAGAAVPHRLRRWRAQHRP